MRIPITVFIAFVLVGCGHKPVSFHSDIQPILNERCIQCHGTQNPAANVVLTSYDSVMAATITKWKKPIVVAGNPSESWLFLRTGTTQPHFRMPPDTLSIMPLTEEQIDLIGRWILEGAKNN